MKIGVVQTRPKAGDIAKNITHHLAHLERAARLGAEITIFPELSLTGYEPKLAKDLAVDPADPRLERFQAISDRLEMGIGVGAPTLSEPGVRISQIFFQSGRSIRLYSKHFLHPDEVPWFVPGDPSPVLTLGGKRIALAICYEISVPAHAERAKAEGASVYLASVAKDAKGVAEAEGRLPEIARQLSAPVLMSNSVGPQADFVAAGGTAVWNEQGKPLGQLGGEAEGLVIFDTETRTAEAIRVEGEASGADS